MPGKKKFARRKYSGQRTHNSSSRAATTPIASPAAHANQQNLHPVIKTPEPWPRTPQPAITLTILEPTRKKKNSHDNNSKNHNK
jgi:hypothetical protein